MICLDTNVLLRLFIGDPDGSAPSNQCKIVKQLAQSSDEPFFINHVVIVETIWVLRQKMKHNKDIIAATVQRLLRMPNVVVRDAPMVATALEIFTQHPGDFSDHLIGEINRRHGCRTTFTFDRAASKSPNFSELAR